MSITRMEHPCFEVACDHCGEGDNADYGGSFHHPDEQTARESMNDCGWCVRDDGKALCESCLDAVEDFTDCPECGAVEGTRCADPHGGRMIGSCHARTDAAMAAL